MYMHRRAHTNTLIIIIHIYVLLCPATYPYIPAHIHIISLYSIIHSSNHLYIHTFTQVLGPAANPSQDFKGDSNVMKVMGAGWTALRLQRLGEWNDEVCARFPRTLELLASLDIPFAVRGVMFARQMAGTGVQPHSDARNFILTMHLGLKVPKDPPGACWMRVAEERKEWEERKALVIDTTFEHETGNESEEDRYVLIIDFWHPELTEAERVALRCVYDLRNKFEGRTAAPSPPLPAKQPSFFDNVAAMFTGGK